LWAPIKFVGEQEKKSKRGVMTSKRQGRGACWGETKILHDLSEKNKPKRVKSGFKPKTKKKKELRRKVWAIYGRRGGRGGRLTWGGGKDRVGWVNRE